jgi:hypothetical protein
MDGRAQIFETLTELYKSRTLDEKARRVRSPVRLTWRWKAHRLGFGCRGAATNVYLKTALAKVRKNVAEARGECELITRVEEKRDIAREKGGPELNRHGIPLGSNSCPR